MRLYLVEEICALNELWSEWMMRPLDLEVCCERLKGWRYWKVNGRERGRERERGGKEKGKEREEGRRERREGERGGKEKGKERERERGEGEEQTSGRNLCCCITWYSIS